MYFRKLAQIILLFLLIFLLVIGVFDFKQKLKNFHHQVQTDFHKHANYWERGKKVAFWPQDELLAAAAINFMLWCATTGSGISVILHQSLDLTPLLQSFYLFPRLLRNKMYIV